MKTNKIFALLLSMACAIGLYSCSDDEDVKPALQDPTVAETAGAYNSLSFEWNEVPNAIQYGYRLSDPDGIAVDAGVTHKKSVTITGLQPATTYTLQVWAFASMDGDYSTPPAVTLTATTDPMVTLGTPANLALASDNGFTYTATWTAVENAIDYVYTIKNSEGETLLTETTTETSATINGLANGDYTFTVYAAGHDGYVMGPSASEDFNVFKSETPIYTVKGTYYSAQLDSSWTAYMDAYEDGTYSIKAFYGVEGYDLNFRVDASNEDDKFTILNGEQVYDSSNGYYTWQIPTGLSNPSVLLTYPWDNYCSFSGSKMEGSVSIGTYFNNYDWGYDEFYWSSDSGDLSVDDLEGIYNCHFSGTEYISDDNGYETYWDDVWTDYATVKKVSDDQISIDGLFYTNEPVTGTVNFEEMSIVFDFKYDYFVYYTFASGDDPYSPAVGFINEDGSITIVDWGLWYNFGTQSDPEWYNYLYGTSELTKSTTANMPRKKPNPQKSLVKKSTVKSSTKPARPKKPATKPTTKPKSNHRKH